MTIVDIQQSSGSPDPVSPTPSAENSIRRWHEHKVSFSGKSDEFFGIWIVNLLLSLLTLGVYSAWAKVRTQQYFHGHTKIDGHHFRYLAQPKDILRGRIIAVTVLASLSLMNHFVPIMTFFSWTILFFAYPWLLLQGLRFNLRNISYRNIRFDFHGTYQDGAKYFLLAPLVTILTAGLALPWILCRIDRFIYSNISYAGRRFICEPKYSFYYKTGLFTFLAAIGFAIAGFAFFYLSAGVFNDPYTGPAFIFLSALLILGLFKAVIQSIYHGIIRNHLYSQTQLPELAKFNSFLSTESYMTMRVKNILLIIFTCGLAYPYTRIRMVKLLAASTLVTFSDQLNGQFEQLAEQSSAAAQELADLYNMDFSLS